MKAILFINGLPPKDLPDVEPSQLVACTDGAFSYLLDKGFPLDKISFVSGDFDSHNFTKHSYPVEFIHTPSQEKTDFHKALDILVQKGVTSVDVYGGSGGEMDHFLGNLSVAHRKKSALDIVFYDEYSQYFFIEKEAKLCDVKQKMISLFPFPTAAGIVTTGLHWNLNNEALSMLSRIGTRNFAIEDEVHIQYSSGDLLVFIGKDNYR